MSRHVEAAATSRVLKVRARFESRIGMQYSTYALDSFYHTHTHTQTTTASLHFISSAFTVTLPFLIGGFVGIQAMKIRSEI
jgi:hypothetical protein